MLKRVLGIVLSVLIGLVPVINILSCGIYALVKKKLLIAACIMAALVVQIVVMTRFADGSNGERTLYIENFTKEIDTTVFNKALVFPTDTAKFTELLKANVQQAAVELSLKNADMKKVLGRIISDTLETYEQGLFDEYSSKVFNLYKNIKAYSGEQSKKKQTIFKFSDQDQVRISLWTRDFVVVYMGNEFEYNYWPMSSFFFMYLCGFALSIFLFKDVLLQQQNTNNPILRRNNKRGARPITEEQVTAVLDDALQTPQAEAPDSFRINFETENKIAQLAGVGAIQAKNIVNERRDNGPFVDMKDFKSRVSLSKRVSTNLEEVLNFSVPDDERDSKGRVIEF